MKIVFDHGTGNLRALDRDIPASCIVRNELNGRRMPDQVVHIENKDGSAGPPYQPRVFPCGSWHVLGASPREDPYLAPYFISTDAWQLVDEWRVDDNGRYRDPVGQMPDYGYGLHTSTSPTTLGCIKIQRRADLLELVRECRAAWMRGESVELEVINSGGG